MKALMTRRKFNTQLGLFGAFLLANVLLPIKKIQAAVAKLKADPNGTLFLTGIGPVQNYVGDSLYAKLEPVASKIYIWDAAQEHIYHDLPFLPHSLSQHPSKPQIICFVGRYHTEACVYDLFEKKILSTMKAAPNSRFFGHSCFSSDGTTVYISENNDKTDLSVLTGWSYSSAEALRKVEVKTGGKRIHDCQLSLDGSFLIACSSGSGGDKTLPNFTWIDAKTNSIHKQITFENLGPSHFHQIQDGHIAIGGGKTFKMTQLNPTLFGIINKAGVYTAAKVPEKMSAFFVGESLSITSSVKKSLVFVTLPSSNSVFVFNYKTLEFIERLEFKNATGVNITPDEKYLIVSVTAPSTRLVWINTSTLKVEKDQDIADSGTPGAPTWGSHIVSIKKVRISS